MLYTMADGRVTRAGGSEILSTPDDDDERLQFAAASFNIIILLFWILFELSDMEARSSLPLHDCLPFKSYTAR